ncbi:hypothetical protein TRFO_15190 [Tritrichomonas foetus]|uniref:Uncharacterized protein n=1 Tax=Tritrichomonas foetus TaxID=1144522 RepID=A0A1J4KXX5_9EUKA|nr:hypothetical protein TRFO_15190 [Tritrichomonas foetus]|eukprot:OHT14413.1 hypothetical protein TRFO_15190 [Tritrichomonas foetus]
MTDRIRDQSPIDDSIKHLCSLNFSIFTHKLQEMRGENRPKDKHGIIRKKWLRIIRGAMKTDGVQSLITYLYAAKTHIHRNQSLTRNFFHEWRNAASQRKYRLAWNKLGLLLRIQEYKNREIKLRECRASLAAEYILAQPQFKRPNFNMFVKQLKPLQIDEPPPPAEEASLLNDTEIKEIPAEIEIPPVQARSASFELDKQEETTESPPLSPRSRSRRIIHIHTSEVSTEPIEHEESAFEKLKKNINYKNVGLTCAIVFILTFFSYHFVSFLFGRLGYYDSYKQYLFNETLPPYNKFYDIDYIINYSEVFAPERELSIDLLLKQMSKEITSMKRKQSEMSDQIERMHEAILQEDL